ncbi:MAG: hypoxanthine phosphoribosyltransferase [Bacteroidota bacterium]
MIKIGDKVFTPFIGRQTIEERISALATQISQDYHQKCPLLVAVLNGSFMFASDLMKSISIPCEITFIKVASYKQLTSTGQIQELIGLKEAITGRHIIVIEDIVDTGLTMHHIIDNIQQQKPQSLEIATLLFKPEALKKDIQPRYVGFEIANRFVVGFGLDYNGLGRNLSELYVLAD